MPTYETNETTTTTTYRPFGWKTRYPKKSACRKRHFGESRMQVSGYRYYSPSLGRWANRDPIGEEGGVNTVGFVSNRPCDAIDFIGLMGLADATVGVAKCGVVVVLSHMFNIQDYRFNYADQGYARRVAFISCYSSTSVPGHPDYSDYAYRVVPHQLSGGLTGRGDDAVNGGFGSGWAGFRSYVSHVLSRSKATAVALCPSAHFLTLSGIERKRKCECYWAKASLGYPEDSFYHYREADYEGCLCDDVMVKFVVPFPDDRDTFNNNYFNDTANWGTPFNGLANNSTAVYDCKTATWSGHPALRN